MSQKSFFDNIFHKIFPLGYKTDFIFLIKNAIPLVIKTTNKYFKYLLMKKFLLKKKHNIKDNRKFKSNFYFNQ